MNATELKEFLDLKVTQYNTKDYIQTDPIQIPHRYHKKEDIEIAAFLVATIAWGNRKMIIRNGLQMMELLDDSPYDFIVNHTEDDLTRLQDFVHRTFNGIDFVGFIQSLQHIYLYHDGLEGIFLAHRDDAYLHQAIINLRQCMITPSFPTRTQKHIANPQKGSAAKRIHMFLRWMIRQDTCGVDFGLWHSLSPAQLSCPLDVHSGRIARRLGLLSRTYNDAKALQELDLNLRTLDADDPAKYDYALFGLGVFEGWK